MTSPKMLDYFGYLKAFHQAMRDAKLERAELVKLIFKRLKNVLVSAYLHVPYYRKIMETSGYNPIKDYCGPKDLAILPITTKEDIQNTGIEATAGITKDLTKYYHINTSGSTGIPFRVYRTPFESFVNIAKLQRMLFANGASIRDKTMTIGSPQIVQYKKRIIQKLGFFRQKGVNYVENSPKTMVDAVLAYKPDILCGNRSHLDLMAMEMRRRGIRAKDLKLLITGAEVIHDGNRQLYRERFGIEAIEHYGSIEMGIVAHETQAHDGLHLCEDLTFFEFLNESGQPVSPGQAGRVVLTDLSATLMPFIRYEQGDRVIYEVNHNCCGCSTRRLTKIIGRDNQFAKLSDGTMLSNHDFNVVIEEFYKIIQFRIIQKESDYFQILIAADVDYFNNIKDDLLNDLNKIRTKVKVNLVIEIVRVEKIETDENGKIRTFVSELKE